MSGLAAWLAIATATAAVIGICGLAVFLLGSAFEQIPEVNEPPSGGKHKD